MADSSHAPWACRACFDAAIRRGFPARSDARLSARQLRAPIPGRGLGGRFTTTLALVAVFVAGGAAATPVTLPVEVLPGQDYRLAFITQATHSPTFSNITVYNDFVTGVADTQPELVALNTTWRAIGSTSAVDARTNTGTNFMLETGVPIFQLDGIRRVADNYADLWDGDIDAPLVFTEQGTSWNSQPQQLWAMTGTENDGTAHNRALGANFFTSIAVGSPSSETSWIHADEDILRSSSFPLHLYAISGTLTAPLHIPTAQPGPHGVTTTVGAVGDAAVDGNGVLNQMNYTPVVNDASAVLFMGEYINTNGGTSDDSAAVLNENGTLTQILRKGEPAPGGNGTLQSFRTPSLNDSGLGAFYATFAGTLGGTADDTGIITAGNGGVNEIAREGQSAPNANGTYFFFNDNDFVQLPVNELDQVAFHARLSDTNNGFSDDNNIVRGSGGPLTEIAREDGLTPTGNGNYGTLSIPVMNDSGTVAFTVRDVYNLNPPFEATMAIVIQEAGISTEIVRRNDVSPDGNGTFHSLSNDLSLSNSGQLAFSTSFQNTDDGLFVDAIAMMRYDGTSLDVIARAGDAAPDGNGVIKSSSIAFTAPKINSFGEVAFRTEYGGTAAAPFDDNALLKGVIKPNQSRLVEIARDGWTAPDGNGEFSDLTEAIDMNEAGVVAFQGTLRNTDGGPGNIDEHGIFLGDGIDLVQVVRGGDVIEGFTVLQLFAGGGRGIVDGGLNEHGQVAFRAQGRRTFQLIDGVFLFTPDLYWRGGPSKSWDDRLDLVGIANPDASRNWTLSLTPDRMHNVIIDRTRAGPRGEILDSVEVAGPGADVLINHLTLRNETHLELTGAHLTASSGILLDGGRLHGAGEVSGDLTVMAGGALEADGLTINGDVVNDGLIGVKRVNNTFGTFHGAIINNGDTVISNANFDPSLGNFHGEFTNNGGLRVDLNQTAEFFGDYLGAGTIDNDGTIIFHGLGPGSSPAHVEIAGTGTIELAATGVTTIELGGTERGSFHGDPLAEFDSMTFVDGGSLSLGGTLNVSLISPDGVAPVYTPGAGDEFTIFLAGVLLGDFEEPLNLPALDPGLRWMVDQDSLSFSLAVTAVPLPAGAWLLVSALFAIPIFQIRYE